MKLLSLVIPITFLFLIGCSTTSKVTDYSSKEEFFKDFNNSVYDRQELKITLTNDSSTVSDGAQIRHDIMFLNDMMLSNNSQIPITKIKQVSYNNHIKGAVPGFLLGTVAGGVLGAAILRPPSGGNSTGVNHFGAVAAGSAIGLCVGVMVGIIIGYNHYFIF